MNILRRYWVYEILLLLIGVCALAFAGFRMAGAGEGADSAPAPAMQPDRVVDSASNGESPSGIAAAIDKDDDELDDLESPAMDDEFSEDGGDDFYLIDAAAEFMQLDIDQVERAVNNGLSLAEIANRAGEDVEALTAAMVAQEQAAIAQLAQNDEISAEEAAEWSEEAQLLTPFFIHTVYFYPETVAARAIGIDEDQLFEQIEATGQTVAEIAEVNGVAPQAVIDAVVASEEQLVDAMVEAGLVEADEAAEWKADIEPEVTQLVMSPIDFDEDGGDEMEEGDDA